MHREGNWGKRKTWQHEISEPLRDKAKFSRRKDHRFSASGEWGPLTREAASCHRSGKVLRRVRQHWGGEEPSPDFERLFVCWSSPWWERLSTYIRNCQSMIDSLQYIKELKLAVWKPGDSILKWSGPWALKASCLGLSVGWERERKCRASLCKSCQRILVLILTALRNRFQPRVWKWRRVCVNLNLKKSLQFLPLSITSCVNRVSYWSCLCLGFTICQLALILSCWCEE